MATPIIMYSRPGCPMGPPVEAALRAAGVEFVYINIWQDEEARAVVRTINNGNESVPTLQFPDGSTLTEPGPRALHRKLTALGYEVEQAQITRSFGLGQMNLVLRLLLLFAAGYGIVLVVQWLIAQLR